MAPITTHPELSLVLAVGSCEESVGREVSNVATHLRALQRSFEIIAVNGGCRDNSLAVLKLVAHSVPELRIVGHDHGWRALARGVNEAQAETLVLWAPTDRAPSYRPLSWAGLGWALSRLDAGRQAVVLRGRYVVARRRTAAAVAAQAPLPALDLERRFERAGQRVPVEVVGDRPSSHGLWAPLRRLVASLVP